MTTLSQQPTSAFCFFLVAFLVTLLRSVREAARCKRMSCVLLLLVYFVLYVAITFAYMQFLVWVHLQGHTLVAWVLSGAGMALALGTLR